MILKYKEIFSYCPTLTASLARRKGEPYPLL